MKMVVSCFFFFFQAEDGIRDLYVTGVQTCALPICLVRAVEDSRQVGVSRVYVDNVYTIELSPGDRQRFSDYERALTGELAALVVDAARESNWAMMGPARVELATAACRERV